MSGNRLCGKASGNWLCGKAGGHSVWLWQKVGEISG